MPSMGPCAILAATPSGRCKRALIRAVAHAYGFADDEDVLAHLLALNLSIAEEEEGGITQPRSPGFEGLPEARKSGFRIEPQDHF